MTQLILNNVLLRQLALAVFGRFELYPTRLTSAKDVQDLLNKLQPVSCSAELVRLGPPGDGGYLVPNDLDGIAALFSPGVSRQCGFESDCARRGIRVFMADGSIDQPPESHYLFHFTRKFVGAISNDDFITLDGWVASSLSDAASELMLQMDIEGGEYTVLLNASDDLMRRFRVIVLETHFLDQLWNAKVFGIMSQVFERLLQTHTCVHSHPNNFKGTVGFGGIDIPVVCEFTFLRNDRVSCPSLATAFPHPLDVDNDPTRTPLVLPPSWYGRKSELQYRGKF